MEHYYTKAPESAHDVRRITVEWRGVAARFDTDASTFSRDALDPGSRLLLDAANARLSTADRILDLGCGWGAIGVLTKLARGDRVHVTMSDVNERALALAKGNAKLNGVTADVIASDGFSAIPESAAFDAILTNPPIRAGKQVIYAMWADARARLTEDGALLIVIRKQQGAPSALTYLRGLYASAEVVERGGGYWVIEARKNAQEPS